MSDVMSILTAFGLAGGAGAKAAVPLLALGLFHHSPWFELGEPFLWLASPPVLVVLGVLVLVEVLADAHPDIGPLSDLASYLPKAVAGFLAAAAVMGNLDENLTQLYLSGALGAVTASGTHWLRNRIRRPIRQLAEDIHPIVGKSFSWGETGASAMICAVAVLAPVLGVVVLAAALGGGWGVKRVVSGTPPTCPRCGGTVPRGAVACGHCQADV